MIFRRWVFRRWVFEAYVVNTQQEIWSWAFQTLGIPAAGYSVREPKIKVDN